MLRMTVFLYLVLWLFEKIKTSNKIKSYVAESLYFNLPSGLFI